MSVRSISMFCRWCVFIGHEYSYADLQFFIKFKDNKMVIKFKDNKNGKDNKTHFIPELDSFA